MNNVINTSRTYGIIFTEDYLQLLNLLKMDMSRRGQTFTNDPGTNLADNKVNKADTIKAIVDNAKKIGYTTSESYDVIIASQMTRLQTFIRNSANQKLKK